MMCLRHLSCQAAAARRCGELRSRPNRRLLHCRPELAAGLLLFLRKESQLRFITQCGESSVLLPERKHPILRLQNRGAVAPVHFLFPAGQVRVQPSERLPAQRGTLLAVELGGIGAEAARRPGRGTGAVIAVLVLKRVAQLWVLVERGCEEAGGGAILLGVAQ